MDSVTGVTEEVLRQMGACSAGRIWARGKTLKQAWKECARGDWLLWLAGRVGVERSSLVLAACDCARLALQHVPPDEDRPRVAIEWAQAWVDGGRRVALGRILHAAEEAEAASLFSPYGSSLASVAAMRAASAARAAALSVTEDAAACWAAHAAADAAEAPLGFPGWVQTQATGAALVRRHIPWSAVKEALSAMECEA